MARCEFNPHRKFLIWTGAIYFRFFTLSYIWNCDETKRLAIVFHIINFNTIKHQMLLRLHNLTILQWMCSVVTVCVPIWNIQCYIASIFSLHVYVPVSRFNAFNNTHTHTQIALVTLRAHECLNKVSINMCDNEESPFQKTIHDRFSASKICVWWTFNERIYKNASQPPCLFTLDASAISMLSNHANVLNVQNFSVSKSRRNDSFEHFVYDIRFGSFFRLFFFHLQIFHHNISDRMRKETAREKKITNYPSHPGSD